MKTDIELIKEAGFELLIDGRISHMLIEKGDCDREVNALIRLVRNETIRDLNNAWYTALKRRFPPGDVAIEGWKCRMVLHDTNGEPCALRQPSHAELRDALAAPEWLYKHNNVKDNPETSASAAGLGPGSEARG